MTVRSAEWLDLMRHEYLRRFIPGGGSAIKFVMGDDASLAKIGDELSGLAREANLHRVAVDAAATKIHMVQDVFFAISRTVDWEGLAQSWVEDVFRRKEYLWPKPGERVSLREIAEANRTSEILLRRDFRTWLTQEIMNESSLAQDFRSAMADLCLRRMEDSELATPPVLEWLKGDLRTIGPVRQVPINSKITRHNGRIMLQSLCRWLRICGARGLLVTLDIRQLGRDRAAAGDGVRFGPAAVLDAYEVLRQLIDDTESFAGLFLVVLADPAFRDDQSKRAVARYPALKERIWPDVHARGHENPLTPLLHIVDSPSAGRADALEMSYNEERVAIEALRAGVPNRAAIRQLGSGETVLAERFLTKLKDNMDGLTAGRAVSGEMVAGTFGSGKSHLLGFLAEQARRENYIVSIVPISKETPLFDPKRVYAAAIRNAVVPDRVDDVMTVVLDRLGSGSDALAELEEWASKDTSSLSPLFPALLHLLPKQTVQPEDKAAIARFLAGADLSVTRVRQWLRAAGSSKLFPIGSTRAAELVPGITID